MRDRHLFGLDLGQAQDYTALAVAQQTMHPAQPRFIRAYAFRHLQRWPLGTSYPQIVADVAGMLTKVPGAELVVDASEEWSGDDLRDFTENTWTHIDQALESEHA